MKKKIVVANNEEILMLDSLKNQELIHQHYTSRTASSKNNSDTAKNFENKFSNNEKSKKQILKMVTSSSKITFLEENTTKKENLNEKYTSTPSNYHFRNKQNLNLNSTESTNLSSIGEKSHFELLENLKNEKTSSIIENNKTSYFINRSYRSELSIEETEPITQKSDNSSDIIDDSINDGSTNFHQVIEPSSSLINLNNNQSNHEENITTINISAQIQKRQDKLLPFRTVIFHDSGFDKDGNRKPQSISYSSISRNIDEINSWKEFDSLIETKQQNSNKSSYNPNFSESIKMFVENSMYSKPSVKIYNEPVKIYSDTSKIYSESTKIYGENESSKIYWPKISPTITSSTPNLLTLIRTTKNPNYRRVIFNLDKLPYDLLNAPQPDSITNQHLETKSIINSTEIHNSSTFQQYHHINPLFITKIKSPSVTTTYLSHNHQNFLNYHKSLVSEKPNTSIISSITESSNSRNIYTPQPEKNYEIDESVSVVTNGRTHGIQLRKDEITFSTPNPLSTLKQGGNINAANNNDDDSKIGYIVEEGNYRKYRVEEKTSDGFIVGEYGVVSYNDGSLRGVRYTADSTINPSLIHEALKKFLSL